MENVFRQFHMCSEMADDLSKRTNIHAKYSSYLDIDNNDKKLEDSDLDFDTARLAKAQAERHVWGRVS